MKQKEITAEEYGAMLERGETNFSGRYFAHLKIVGQAEMNYSDCRFMECSLEGQDFSACSFEGAIINSDMRDCIFQSCNFKGATLYGSKVESCDFLNADFSDSSMKRIRVRNSDLSGVSFLLATLDGVQMDNIIINHPVQYIDTATITMGGATGQECEQNRERIYAALQEISQDKINHIIQKVEASTRLIQKHTRIIAENNDRMKQYVNPSASEKSENIQTEVSQKATIRPVRKQIQEKNRKIVLSK